MHPRLKTIVATASVLTAIGGGFILSRFDVISNDTATTANAAPSVAQNLPASTIELTADSSLAEISAKMLNSDRFYSNLSARLESVLNGQEQLPIAIQIEQPDRYRVETADVYLAIGNGTQAWIRNGSGLVTVEGKANAIPQAVVQPLDGGPIILPQYATELLGAGEAATMLHPFSIVWGVFLAGDVAVTGEATESGRRAIVLDVTPKAEHVGGKFGSLRRYFVDAKTGIVLRQEQYHNNGELRSRDTLLDVVIDANEFNGDFSLQISDDEAFAPADDMKR